MRNLSKRNATQHQQTCLRHANPYAPSKRRRNANQPRDTRLMGEQKRGSVCGNTARQFRELRVGISDDRISRKLRIENRLITWHRWRLRQALRCVTRPAPLSRLDARKSTFVAFSRAAIASISRHPSADRLRCAEAAVSPYSFVRPVSFTGDFQVYQNFLDISCVPNDPNLLVSTLGCRVFRKYNVNYLSDI